MVKNLKERGTVFEYYSDDNKLDNDFEEELD